MINAGKYNHKINVYEVITTKDSQGFPIETLSLLLQPYAHIKTTRGFTLIANNSDFEKAYTNFTIRYSQTIENAYYLASSSNRDILITFKGKTFKIEYLRNVDEASIELEMQCKEVLK